MKYHTRSKVELVADLKSLQAINEPGDQFQRTLHELQVHQIELEMQNRDMMEAQQELEESRNRYADLYDFAPVGYITLDDKKCIQEINLTGASMLGRERSQLLGKAFISYVVVANRKKFIDHVEECQKAEEKISAEIDLIVTGGGNMFTSQLVSLAVYDPAKQATLVRMAMTDVTKRKQVEAALQEERALLGQRTEELRIVNEQLVRASRLKDEFLANMSHELRTPLTAILGISEALQEQIYGTLNDKQLKSIHGIEESGQHLLMLINDILDLSKIEAGKLELEISLVEVESVCEACNRLVTPAANKKQLQFSLSLDPAVTAIRADERRLKEILLNLLSNAVKFTPQGGAIGLQVKGEAEKELVHFIVWDTGIGIAPENVKRLFQAFVQLDSNLSREHTGTGLGLALVKRLVDLHGGQVSVESPAFPSDSLRNGEGKGTRFIISLPWKKVTPPPATFEPPKAIVPPVLSAAVSPGPESSEKQFVILIAEDYESSLEVLSDFLSEKGFRVILARDGNEILERAKQEHPNLILMDIQMPGMHGLEAIRRIRGDDALKRIPIIVMTALAMFGDREQCLEAGANDYLSKPLSLKGVMAMIQENLR